MGRESAAQEAQDILQEQEEAAGEASATMREASAARRSRLRPQDLREVRQGQEQLQARPETEAQERVQPQAYRFQAREEAAEAGLHPASAESEALADFTAAEEAEAGHSARAEPHRTAARAHRASPWSSHIFSKTINIQQWPEHNYHQQT